MNKYTIIASVYRQGIITYPIKENEVRKECERLKKVLSKDETHKYIQIEVVNNETGEVREYWNNSNNEIKF